MRFDKLITEEMTRWYLEAVETNNEWMVAIEAVPFIIGRDEDCHLKLTSKWISRHHAEIHKSGDHLWIRDLGSTNGTFVNNKQILQAELLEPGDTVALGKSKFNLKKVLSTANSIAEATFSMDFAENRNLSAALEPKLRALLSARNVIPHFQPIFRLANMNLEGYEILGRVADDELPSNPADLLDVAEWLGCAAELSTLFRDVGMETAKGLPGSPLIFANTSPLEIYQTDALLESLQKLDQKAPVNKMVLEVNEKAATHANDMSRLRDGLNHLSIQLAFDDFGVGQTRLAELAKAPPDFLKFDFSLIHQIHLAPKRLHQMVSTFVKASQDLGIATLAEGIECVDEAETCRQLGFDFAQGFFYGKPLPFSEINLNT